MPKASDLLDIDDFYTSNSIHDDGYFKSRSVHELAEGQCILEGTPTDEKLERVKENNKKSKINPPTITKGFKRPKFSDMDIALIQASYNTVSLSTLAHLLGTTENHVKATYKETNKYHIPLMPLVTVVDTSRYIEPDVERVIYASDDLNHLDDPRTNKELLRLNEAEYKYDAEIFKRFTCEKFEGLNIDETLGGLKLRIFFDEDVQDQYFGFYGRSWSSDYRGVLTSGIPTDRLIPYLSSYRNKYGNKFYLFHYIQKPKKYNNFLLKFLNPNSNLSIKYLTSISLLLNSTSQYIHLFPPYNSHDEFKSNNKTDNKLNSRTSTHDEFKSNNKTDNKFTIPILTSYTTNLVLSSNYKPDKNTGNFYLPYLVTRPKLYERSLGSPILDNNKRLRYAMYHAKRIKTYNLSYKENTYYFGVRCRECNSFLSPHTITSCPHIKIKSTLDRRIANKREVKFKPITLHLNTIKDEKLRNIILNHFTFLKSTNRSDSRINVKTSSLNNLKFNSKSDNKITTHDEFKSNNKTDNKLNSRTSSLDLSNIKLKSPHLYAYGRKLTKTSSKINNTFTSYNTYQYKFSNTVYQHLEIFIGDPINNLDIFTLHYYKYISKLKIIKPETLGIYDISKYNVYSLYTQFHTVLQSTTQEPELG